MPLAWPHRTGALECAPVPSASARIQPPGHETTAMPIPASVGANHCQIPSTGPTELPITIRMMPLAAMNASVNHLGISEPRSTATVPLPRCYRFLLPASSTDVYLSNVDPKNINRHLDCALELRQIPGHFFKCRTDWQSSILLGPWQLTKARKGVAGMRGRCGVPILPFSE